MTDISLLDTLRIENQATPASMAYHAARQPGPNSGLTAVTSIYTKQTAVALDGRPIGRIHALTDVVSGGNVYRAESYRVPGFWCGRSLWSGDGPDGYFLDPLAALSALIGDYFGEVATHETRRPGASSPQAVALFAQATTLAQPTGADKYGSPRSTAL